jgi:hypothetical protein
MRCAASSGLYSTGLRQGISDGATKRGALVEGMDSAQMLVALAMIGVGVGGWIGIGLSVLVLRGRFKAVAGAIFAVGGIAAAGGR